MTTEDIVSLIARQEYLTAQLKVQVLKDPIVKEDTFTALTNLLKVSEALDDGICENLGIEYIVKLRMGQF